MWSDEGGVAEHGSGAQEGAQAQGSSQGGSRAVVVRRRQAREGGRGRRCGRPGGLQGGMGVMREGSSLQVVAEGVACRQRAGERQPRWVGLHPSLFTLPPLCPSVLEPHLSRNNRKLLILHPFIAEGGNKPFLLHHSFYSEHFNLPLCFSALLLFFSFCVCVLNDLSASGAKRRKVSSNYMQGKPRCSRSLKSTFCLIKPPCP